MTQHAHLDFNIKAVLALTLRVHYSPEESNATYSGLTEAEYAVNSRQKPFKNDFMYADRYGVSATHEFAFSDDVILTTNLSWFNFSVWLMAAVEQFRPTAERQQ